MTVQEEGVIDAIGLEPTTDSVVLTISDHLEWDDANEHLLTLQNKINRYLAFIESGELVEKYADAKGRSVRIEIMCKYKPSEVALRFLSKAESSVRDAGFAFGWRVFAA